MDRRKKTEDRTENEPHYKKKGKINRQPKKENTHTHTECRK